MDKGYLYIALGQQSFAEAELSVRSLRTFLPNAHVTLVTDQDVRDSDFDQVNSIAKVNSRHEALSQKIRCIAGSPYERTFFVDSDTLFLDGCTELFNILDHFDICMAHSPADNAVPTVNGQPLPGYYPYNTGVMVYRKSKANTDLFKVWETLYAKEELGRGHQPAFMSALAAGRSRVYVLQNIYNARVPYHISMIAEQVKILHGREDLQRIAKRINENSSNRSWHPETGLSNGPTASVLQRIRAIF